VQHGPPIGPRVGGFFGRITLANRRAGKEGVAMLDHDRNLLPGLILAAMLGGCATQPGLQLYPGPQKARSEIATLIGPVDSVDGQVVRFHTLRHMEPVLISWPTFDMLPGRRRIVIWSGYPHAAQWVPEYTVEIDAKAGHRYFVDPGGALWRSPQVRENVESIEARVAESRHEGKEVGRVVGRVVTLPDSTEGQSPTWKVQLVAAGRTKSSQLIKEIPAPGDRTLLWMDTDLRRRLKTGLGAVGDPPVYILTVGLRFQYAGPDGEVLAPGTWLICNCGRVIRALAMIGVTKAAKASETDVFEGSPLRKWLMSGRDLRRETHRLSSGETFFSDFPEAVWHYYFLVSDNIAPDQLRLAFGDVVPLRLPNVTLAD
jgi:hypothetical protein